VLRKFSKLHILLKNVGCKSLRICTHIHLHSHPYASTTSHMHHLSEWLSRFTQCPSRQCFYSCPSIRMPSRTENFFRALKGFSTFMVLLRQLVPSLPVSLKNISILIKPLFLLLLLLSLQPLFLEFLLHPAFSPQKHQDPRPHIFSLHMFPRDTILFSILHLCRRSRTTLLCLALFCITYQTRVFIAVSCHKCVFGRKTARMVGRPKYIKRSSFLKRENQTKMAWTS
jgi:hypothetical protein